MPREIVHCDGPFHVKIGWADGRDVQLGVEGDEGRGLSWLLYGEEHTRRQIGREIAEHIARMRNDQVSFDDAQIGAAVLNVLDGLPLMPPAADDEEGLSPGGVVYGFRGVWADLSRHGCNRLIKLLRRARDAAYGADA